MVDAVLNNAAQVGLNNRLPPGEKTDMLRSFGGNAILPPALMLKTFLELPPEDQEAINQMSVTEVLSALILMTSHLYAVTPEITEGIKTQLAKAADIKYLHSAIMAISFTAVLSQDDELHEVLNNIRQRAHQDSSKDLDN